MHAIAIYLLDNNNNLLFFLGLWYSKGEWELQKTLPLIGDPQASRVQRGVLQQRCQSCERRCKVPRPHFNSSLENEVDALCRPQNHGDLCRPPNHGDVNMQAEDESLSV
jgi:hypothetical protein